jgi:putative endonuclease
LAVLPATADSSAALRNDKQKKKLRLSCYHSPMAKPEYDFFVYIAASRSHQFYVGFTNGLQRRMKEHKEHHAGTYTARYNIDRLVYYEHFQYAINAIAREKELKDWNRAKKIALIESINPTWRDLSEDWGKSMFATADSSAALRNDKQKESVE